MIDRVLRLRRPLRSRDQMSDDTTSPTLVSLHASPDSVTGNAIRWNLLVHSSLLMPASDSPRTLSR